MFKKEIVTLLKKHIALSKEEIEKIIETPSLAELGDYAFPCFTLSKLFKKNPNEIAKDIASKLEPTDLLDAITPTGPYINFFVNKIKLASYTISSVLKQKEKYGKTQAKSKIVLLEGWQPNTHKAFHIGHIRNAVLSESLARILEFYGNKVIRASYMGDIGAHVAKWIWYFKKFYKGKIPKNEVSKWAGDIYTKATIKSEESDECKKEIDEIHRKLEEGDKELIQLWKKTKELCLKDFWKIYKELDCKIQRSYFESEVEEPGKAKVKDLAKKGLAEYSEGALIINLEKYGLGIFVLLKSNGASLYSTKDIALAYLKSKEYNFDASLYIVASEQDHHFRQLFKTLELMGYKDANKLNHVSFGLVKLEEGKMSSRAGNIVLYEDFRNQLCQKVEEKIKGRPLQKKQKQAIINAVAFGAMKFTMLSQASQKEVIFVPQQALSFEGETGPYIQYAHARANSILQKSNIKKITNQNFSLLNNQEEHELIKELFLFPEIVSNAADSLKPNLIANYTYVLAHSFGEYYHKHKVISKDKALTKARLSLVLAIKQVIKNGLFLLSIEAPEKM